MTLSGCSARAIAAAPAGAAKIGPSTSWHGAAGSGFSSIPTDAVRTTAKPALRWNVAQFQRFAGDLVVIAEADALGGIAYVDFFVEGNTVRVSNWTRVSDFDVNGNPRTRTGYAFTLDHAAFMAQSPAGNTINIYARATANDSRIQARTIGPLTLYPEATESDFVKTIRLDGTGDYTSIKNALHGAQAAGAKAPMFTFTQAGFYGFEDGDWGAWYTGKGYAVFQGANGVLATVGRGTFPAGNTAIWNINPLWNGVEFRGKNVLIDHRNFVQITNNNGTTTAVQNHRLNGTKVTNSIGTKDSFYWNKGYKPQNLFNSQPNQKPYGAIPGYSGGACIEDTIFEYGNAQVMNTELCRAAKLHNCFERLWNGGMACFDNYSDQNNISFFRAEHTALSISYTGAGTASVALAGNNGTTGRLLTLALNGSTVAGGAITLGALPNDTFFTLASIRDYINNTIGGGWSSTLIDTAETLNPSYLGLTGQTHGFSAQSIASGGTLTMVTHVEVHSGGGNFYFPGGTVENLIWRNNVALNIDSDGDANHQNFSDILMDTTGICNDLVFDANIWDGGNLFSIAANCPLSHYVVRNSILNRISVRITANNTWNIDQYCAFQQNVIVPRNTSPAVSLSSGSMPTYPAFTDNFAPGVPVGTTGSGNFGTSGDTVFVDPVTTKDFRPAGVLLSTGNKRAPLRQLDFKGTTRAVPDAVGPFAATAAAPIWPTGL